MDEWTIGWKEWHGHFLSWLSQLKDHRDFLSIRVKLIWFIADSLLVNRGMNSSADPFMIVGLATRSNYHKGYLKLSNILLCPKRPAKRRLTIRMSDNFWHEERDVERFCMKNLQFSRYFRLNKNITIFVEELSQLKKVGS